MEKEVIHHVLELLRITRFVEKVNNKYYSRFREVAELVLEAKK